MYYHSGTTYVQGMCTYVLRCCIFSVHVHQSWKPF